MTLLMAVQLRMTIVNLVPFHEIKLLSSGIAIAVRAARLCRGEVVITSKVPQSVHNKIDIRVDGSSG